MTSAHQLLVSWANLALCRVKPGSPAHFCFTQACAVLHPAARQLPIRNNSVFFMKWFCSANKGSLGQLNLCLRVPDQLGATQRCDFIDAYGTASLEPVCVCKQEPVPVGGAVPIFPKLIGSKCVYPIDSKFSFPAFILGKIHNSSLHGGLFYPSVRCVHPGAA